MLAIFDKEKNNITNILIFVIPISFVFSRFFLEIAILILIFIFLFNSTIEEKTKIFQDKLIQLFLLFWVILIISSLFSEFKIKSLKTSLPYLRHILMIFAFIYIFRKNEKRLVVLFISFVSIFSFLSLSGIYEYFIKLNCNIVNNPSGTGYIFDDKKLFCNNNFFIGSLLRVDRTSGFFGDELVIGSFLSRFLPFVLALYFLLKDSFNASNSMKNICLFLFILIVGLAIILSGERLAFFYFCLFLFCFSFFYFGNVRKLIFFYISIIISFFVIFSLNPIIKQRIVDQTWLQFNNQFDKDKGDNRKILFFSKEHTAHYKVAYKIFSNNIILGSGPKTFREMCKKKEYNLKGGCSTHPHNTFLQLLSETGIIGFLIPFVILAKICFKIIHIFWIRIKAKNSDRYILPYSLFLLCFLISLFPILPAGNFFNNWLSIIYFFPIAFLKKFQKY